MAQNATVGNGNDDRSDATKLQDRAINGIDKSLDDGHDAFLFGPTGVGKSRMFSMVASKRVEKGERVLVLSHRQNLVKQGQRNMERWVDEPIAISEGMEGHIDQSGSVVYSTIQTAHELILNPDETKRVGLTGYDLVIIDEAHHATSDNKEYAETLNEIITQNPNIRVMGASATPPDGYEGLHDRLRGSDKHVITFKEAIDAKLVRVPVSRTVKMDYKDGARIEDIVQSHRKNSKSADLEGGIKTSLTKMRADDWPDQLVYQYKEHLEDKRTLAFFDEIKDLKAFMDAAKKEGITVAAIHSKQDREENERLKEAFEKGHIKVLASVDMISEGYDIDCTGILLDKKTTSMTEFRQIIGRGSRGHGEDNKARAVLIDTGASTLMHGNIAAQIAANDLRANLEGGRMPNEALLPGKSEAAKLTWVEMTVESTGRKVWGTSVGKSVIYAVPTEDGYATFEKKTEQKNMSKSKSASKAGIKGKIGINTVELLKIEGVNIKGRHTAKDLGSWYAKQILSDGGRVGRLINETRSGMTSLQEIVLTDWKESASSIESNMVQMERFPMAIRAGAVQAMSQRHAAL